MREKWKEKRQEGVITAFFALVLLLVIAMLLCMAESARLTACSRMAQSILRLGTKSLLSSYDLPLYENYHIFGRSVGEDDVGKELAEELSWYLKQNLSGGSWLCMQADMPEIAGLSVLTKEDGAMFYAQAVQYEKYRETEEFVEWLVSAVLETKKAERVGVLLQKSLQVEEGAAKAEETLAELLGCLDGFTVEEGSLVRGMFGGLKTTGSFAKRLVPNGAGEWILAGNAELYKAQKGNYTDPLQELKNIADNQNRANNIESSLSSMRRQYEEIRVWEPQSEEEEEEWEAVSARQRELSEGISAAERELSSCRDAMKRQLADLLVKLKGAKAQSEKALELLNRLEEERGAAKAELSAYSAELSGFFGEVPESVYEEMKQQNQELLEKFSDENSLGILKDIRGMREALEHNIGLFTTAEIWVESVQAYLQDTIHVLSGATNAAAYLSRLKISELVLDYADVRVPERSNPYTKLAKQFFKYGILSLVVEDEDTVGEGRIRDGSLPSQLYTGEQEKGAGFSFKKLFEGTKEEPFSLSFGDTGGFLGRTAEELAEEFLYLSYLKRHFAAYADGIGAESAEQKPVLQTGEGAVEGLLYQLEYIIAGEESDWENLGDIAVKIFLIRFAMNLAVIFSSHECREQIKAAAVAAVGFTGIGALIVFAELLVAMLWAAECALTEACGLFRSGEVSFFPTAGALAIQFSELSKVSKEFWQQKAEKYTQTKAGGILKNYREYLYLFLALEKPGLRTMRTMDVVQQVMRLKYNEDFRMQSCIYAVETKAEITIPYLFLPVAGIRAGEGIKQEKRAGISY